MQRGVVVAYFLLLAWTLAWFFALGNPSGVQGEFAIAVLSGLGVAVYKFYTWNPKQGGEK